MPVNKCKSQKEMKEWKYTKQKIFGRVREFEYLKDSVQDDKTINIFLKNSGNTMKNEGVKKKHHETNAFWLGQGIWIYWLAQEIKKKFRNTILITLERKFNEPQYS